jgi:hypothetical protein
MKKTKEDATSAGTPKQQKKPEKKGRLSSMLESMQKRSSPVNAHKVATKYFDDFKKDRSISTAKEAQENTTEVTTGVITAKSSPLNTEVSNAVDTTLTTAVEKKQNKPSPPKSENIKSGIKILDDSHSNSESKVYLFMKEKTDRKKSSKLRFGLKELMEKTGLSDKTIRKAIHSLEEKMSIKVVEPSLGVYGRKIEVYSPDEIKDKRKKAGLVIDSTTKKIMYSDTEVGSAINNAVTTAVVQPHEHKSRVIDLYENYTGNKWGEKEEKFYKTIGNVKPETLEAALILGTIKEDVKNSSFSDFKVLIKDAGDSVTKPYLDHLRDIWHKLREK